MYLVPVRLKQSLNKIQKAYTNTDTRPSNRPCILPFHSWIHPSTGPFNKLPYKKYIYEEDIHAPLTGTRTLKYLIFFEFYDFTFLWEGIIHFNGSLNDDAKVNTFLRELLAEVLIGSIVFFQVRVYGCCALKSFIGGKCRSLVEFYFRCIG